MSIDRIPEESNEAYIRYFTNEQIMFDYIINRIAEQGVPAMTVSGECDYHPSDECRCAGGWLIPFGHEVIQGSIDDGKVKEVLSDLPYIQEHTPFLRAMQDCHDSCSDDHYNFLDRFLAGCQEIIKNGYYIDFAMSGRSRHVHIKLDPAEFNRVCKEYNRPHLIVSIA